GHAPTVDCLYPERFIFEINNCLRQSLILIVLYPESTPIMEAYRAMLDLKEAGIETQMVVANLVLPPEACVNEFFANRRQMQTKYLREITERFNLPVLQFPMMSEEMKGFEALRHGLAIIKN
ncbi:MAG: arsenic-transporting ATPase, partial [Firmicutes bacterium]|nr:arsenic-transporting ATPase [Bacillota bacterium]